MWRSARNPGLGLLMMGRTPALSFCHALARLVERFVQSHAVLLSRVTPNSESLSL